tara:strand:+ start:110 stop:379 length:270 start_codon:yes stop_codon:yes gene_type:complete
MKIETTDFTNFLAAGGQLTMDEWMSLSDEDRTKASVVGITMRMRESERAIEYLIEAVDNIFGEAQMEASLDIIAAKLRNREHISTLPTG